jgi:hypothetical protein
MASFAEIDQNNVVLRVLKACSQDIENNGGSQSDQAATHFENVAPLSPLGVKWIETSKTGAFRVRHAGPGMIYEPSNDRFVAPQPFASWTQDNTGAWNAPVDHPNTTAENGRLHSYEWDEDNQTWNFIE